MNDLPFLSLTLTGMSRLDLPKTWPHLREGAMFPVRRESPWFRCDRDLGD